MINVHTELLPDYPGAQSIIWPIYNMERRTGFTIHKIVKKIDKGDILYVKACPIFFESSLRKTVEKNLEVVRNFVPFELSKICDNFQKYFDGSTKQTYGVSRTTPTVWEFIKMMRNHNKLYLEDVDKG